MSAPDYPSQLSAMGLSEADVPYVVEAARFSDARIEAARLSLEALPACDGAAVLGLGSLGRYEASPASDLDVAFLFDPSLLPEAEAERLRAEVLSRLRAAGFEVAEKTFDKPIDARTLLRNIGGRNETNEHLTYRALLLTESAWFYNPGYSTQLRDDIFGAYRNATVSRGRHLASLGNDLHRYYRTLCLDYRWKVEEEGKEWAIRVMKLRHSRKIWHLANIAIQCAAREAEERGDDYDATLLRALGAPPLVKIATTAEASRRTDLSRRIFIAYDYFLRQMRSPEVRSELLALRYEDGERSALYVNLRENAQALQSAAGELFHHFYERHRDHLMRFTIL
jgi:hypothetical protein